MRHQIEHVLPRQRFCIEEDLAIQRQSSCDGPGWPDRYHLLIRTSLIAGHLARGSRARTIGSAVRPELAKSPDWTAMADPFFDLGKHLPQVDGPALKTILATEDEVFEKAYVPSSTLEGDAGSDRYQFKDKRFKQMRFYETRFARIVFTRCTFEECLFLGAHFEDCAFHQCTFIRCNTNKFRLSRTYLDPRSFLRQIFDRRKYANVGVDLFHTLLKNSVDETQPEFRDVAEYHFRLWQRYNRRSYWALSQGRMRWLDFGFYGYWLWNVLFQWFLGYGVRARNIVFWTPVLFCLVWTINYHYWSDLGVDSGKLAGIPLITRSAFFTAGNLSTFGTGDLAALSQVGLVAVSVQVVLGISWIALSTAMIVKRFVR